MRTWVLGGCLAAVAVGGVCFVVAGGRPSHCGPCVAHPAPPPAAPESPPPEVVEVVDVAAALAKPAEPNRLPFVSFDEPPLANPPAEAPDVIQAAAAEPALMVEVAPMPRLVEPDRGPMPLASPNDPY
jgi:hypothetical protein